MYIFNITFITVHSCSVSFRRQSKWYKVALTESKEGKELKEYFKYKGAWSHTRVPFELHALLYSSIFFFATRIKRKTRIVLTRNSSRDNLHQICWYFWGLIWGKKFFVRRRTCPEFDKHYFTNRVRLK